MEKIIHRANTRGSFDYGWLQTNHTFSFSKYYNPDRMQFGALRVLNDDYIQPRKGFGMHPHNDMEIISVILKGELAHKDNIKNGAVLKAGDVQVMSAGTGIVHSEYNNSETDVVNILQIWILPKKTNVNPRYDEKSYSPKEKYNKLLEIVTPDKSKGKLWINQDAYLHLGGFDKDFKEIYSKKIVSGGLYFFIIEGSFEICGEKLYRRDGMGILDEDHIEIKALEKGELLVIEVPVK